MKYILWISRHQLTREQLDGLRTFCGGDFSLEQWENTVEDLAALREAVARADVIAAVLPVQLLAGLVAMAGGKPVLVDTAVRTLLPGDGPEPQVCFSSGGWQRVLRLEVELAPAQD